MNSSPSERVDILNEPQVLDRKQELESRLNRLKSRYNSTVLINRFSLLIGITVFISVPLIYNFLKIDTVYIFLSILYGFVVILTPFLRSTRQIEIDIRDIENDLDLLSISQDSIELRAEKQFKLHQLELKKYYDINLRQSVWIFYIGLICIVLGFVIIGFTIYLIYSSFPGTDLSEKILLASLGAIAGILSDFVGMVYIKMYSETIKSLTDFHNKLVITHFLHFGNFLIGKIQNVPLREKTLAEIASNLVKQEFVSKPLNDIPTK